MTKYNIKKFNLAFNIFKNIHFYFLESIYFFKYLQQHDVFGKGKGIATLEFLVKFVNDKLD
jgi:hypothetical protein